jgi:HK97 family phage prohead protease
MSADTQTRPPRDGLVRASRPGLEFRLAEDDGMPTLYGHFAVFNEWTEIHSIFEGDFLERIAPGAFKKTFREQRDEMRVLYQHGYDFKFGDDPLGPIDVLREDDEGGYYEVPLLDTPLIRGELVPRLEANLLGASFRFRVMREEFDEEPDASEDNPKGMPERTIKEAQVFEFGPVTFPAYEGATAGVRSLTDQFIFERLTRNPERLRELLEALPQRPGEAEEGDQETNGAGGEPHPVPASRSIPNRLWRLGRKEEAWKLP